VAGRTGRRDGRSLPWRPRFGPPGRACLVPDRQDQYDEMPRVPDVLANDGIGSISFAAGISPVRAGGAAPAQPRPCRRARHRQCVPGFSHLAEGSVPGLWRAGARGQAGPVADPAWLERTLRERLPGAIGATEAEIAAAEARPGITMPAEPKVIYRVTRARREDQGEDHAAGA
jgi:hypothetical protein